MSGGFTFARFGKNARSRLNAAQNATVAPVLIKVWRTAAHLIRLTIVRIREGSLFRILRKDGTYEGFQNARPHCKMWRAIARRHGAKSSYYASRRTA